MSARVIVVCKECRRPRLDDVVPADRVVNIDVDELGLCPHCYQLGVEVRVIGDRHELYTFPVKVTA